MTKVIRDMTTGALWGWDKGGLPYKLTDLPRKERSYHWLVSNYPVSCDIEPISDGRLTKLSDGPDVFAFGPVVAHLRIKPLMVS
jgi:hypothetical protein